MGQAADASKTISLKLIVGPVEIDISNADADLLTADLKKVLHALDDNVEALESLHDKLGGLPTKDATDLRGSQSQLTKLSLSEMIKKSGVKKEVDRTLLAAYYLFRGMKMPVFNKKDVDEMIATARLPEPGNLNQTLNDLVDAEKLREAGEKEGLKGFTITSTGEEEAEALLSGSRKKD